MYDYCAGIPKGSPTSSPIAHYRSPIQPSIEETVLQLRQLLPEASRPLTTGAIDRRLFTTEPLAEGVQKRKHA
jgi:hypothetical protein